MLRFCAGIGKEHLAGTGLNHRLMPRNAEDGGGATPVTTDGFAFADFHHDYPPGVAGPRPIGWSPDRSTRRCSCACHFCVRAKHFLRAGARPMIVSRRNTNFCFNFRHTPNLARPSRVLTAERLSASVMRRREAGVRGTGSAWVWTLPHPLSCEDGGAAKPSQRGLPAAPARKKTPAAGRLVQVRQQLCAGVCRVARAGRRCATGDVSKSKSKLNVVSRAANSPNQLPAVGRKEPVKPLVAVAPRAAPDRTVFGCRSALRFA